MKKIVIGLMIALESLGSTLAACATALLFAELAGYYKPVSEGVKPVFSSTVGLIDPIALMIGMLIGLLTFICGYIIRTVVYSTGWVTEKDELLVLEEIRSRHKGIKTRRVRLNRRQILFGLSTLTAGVSFFAVWCSLFDLIFLHQESFRIDMATIVFMLPVFAIATLVTIFAVKKEAQNEKDTYLF